MKIIYKLIILIFLLSSFEFFAQNPIARDDDFVLRYTSNTIILDITLNDVLFDEGEVTVRIISTPEYGTLLLNDDNTVSYIFEGEDEAEVEFEYELCITNASGQTYCDEAIVFIKIIRQPEIPGGLTPNGDGINDVFRVEGPFRPHERLEIRIVNRWGDLVFEHDDYGDAPESELWDGTFRRTGDQLPQGAYYFFINVYRNEIKVNDPLTGVIHIFR